MAYLHNNKDQFQDAIELAYEQTGREYPKVCVNLQTDVR